jgi:hypothetical protein
MVSCGYIVRFSSSCTARVHAKTQGACMRFRIRLAIVSLLLCLFPTLTIAQSTTSLHGIVSDPKGALLPGATVKLSDPKTGFVRTVVSGNDGVYQFLQVPPATYTVEVTAAGFAAAKVEKVTLQVATPATLNFSLKVQGAHEQVEVTSEAPLVNTQDASIGNAFTERQLQRLPSEGRDPVSILSLQPGVTFIGSDKQIDQTNDSRGGSVAGARSDQTNITLDGLDNNEQLNGNAFQGALRATLDSLQEFRVTTSNGNADEGRSSGGQVTLVTKSGTNALHGSVYEYNRSGIGEANDWFNEAAQVGAGLPNKPPHLIRNTFGATFGGPLKKDRMFFFLAYEGQRKRETTQVTQTVPSDALRNGMIQYLCNPNASPSDPNCAVGTPASGVTVINNPAVSATDNVVQLSPAALSALDPNAASNGTCPWANGSGQCGVDPNVLQVFQQYPHTNSDTVGDLLDYRGYTFAGASPEKLNTYILRLDYKITPNGNHSLFLRANLQNDNQQLAPEFPGQPPGDFHTANNKGIAAGYSALLSPTLINSLRWSLVREGVGDSGVNSQPYVHFRTLSDLTSVSSQSEYFNLPVHNFVDDVTWTKGKHTLQFGANLRLLHNNRSGNFQNVSYAVTDPFSLPTGTIANSGSSLDPSIGAGYPLVDPAFGELYDFAATGLAGLVTVENAVFNQDKTGTLIPPGALISRHFKSWEAEWYAQDAWRVTPHLVITAGLRYSLLQPPYEANGNQAAPNVSVGSLFAQRAQAQLAGQSYSPGQNAANGVPGGLPPVTFGISGQANGKQPYWNWDYRNLAPRLAVAYSPHFDNGWLHHVFGSAGKSSVRMGYGLYFDHFGEGLVDTFDRQGSFGLTTTETNPYAVQTVDCAYRFTGLYNLPQGQYCGQTMNGVTPGPFPVTPPLGVNAPGGFAIYWGMDDKLKTPYSHVFNFSFSRDLGRNFALEVSYVGRLGRHLLQETDLALPQDIVDRASHTDYFAAATQFAKLANAGTPVSAVNPTNAGMYWEDLFASAAGPASTQLYSTTPCPGIPFGTIDPNSSTLTATQAMYDTFACNVGNEVVALQYADTPTFAGACFPGCSQLPGQSSPQAYNFFMPQFSSLWGWRTSGNSSYHALNVTLRRALSSGIQFDVNYTFSKSIDVGSNAERISLFDANGVGGFSSQVVNSWAPNQLRAVSDFDMKHQLNSNWVIDLPVGRGRKFASGMGRVADAIIGGWSLTGLFHWSSGLPFSIFPGGGWSTNYNVRGEAIEVANPGPVGVHRDASGNPTMFANPAVINDFRHPYPGEGGQRNELRGPGYFGIDAGLDKDWKVRENQTLSFAWEAFNVTNAVRFDAALSSNNFDTSSVTSFGVYSNTLTQPRVMQFMLRYSF